MTGPLTTPSFSLISSIAPQARSYCGALLGEDQATVLVLLLEHERLELVVDRDDVVRIDVVPDGQLPRRDHTLRLEPDVEQHLVAVDLDDAAGDDVAVVELDDGGVDRVGERDATEVVEHDETVALAVVGLIRATGVGATRHGVVATRHDVVGLRRPRSDRVRW